MRGSVAFEEGVSAVPNRAYGHSRDSTGWRRTDQSNTSAVLGDGGVTAPLPSRDGGTNLRAWINAWATGDAGWPSTR